MRVHRTAQPYMKMYIFNCFSFFFHCCNVEISWWKYYFFVKSIELVCMCKRQLTSVYKDVAKNKKNALKELLNKFYYKCVRFYFLLHVNSFLPLNYEFQMQQIIHLSYLLCSAPWNCFEPDLMER